MALKHWSHDRKYFYKYLTAKRTKTVLGTGTLRWSSPVLFNDPFDVQFNLHMEYDRDRVASRIMDALVDGYFGKIPIARKNALGIMLAILKQRSPDIAEQHLRDTLTPGIYQGMDRAEALLPRTHDDIKAALAGLKLLCLSEVNSNILMWSHYSGQHTGAVIELECIEELDSGWGAARPVTYRKAMPLLVDEEKLFRIMTGSARDAENAVLEDSVFVKATDWSYEKEWRLISTRNKTKQTEDYPFHPQELSAVYLGCRIAQQDANDIQTIVSAKYPHAQVYFGRKSERKFEIEFVPPDTTRLNYRP